MRPQPEPLTRREVQQFARSLQRRLRREQKRPGNAETVAHLKEEIAAIRHLLKVWREALP